MIFLKLALRSLLSLAMFGCSSATKVNSSTIASEAKSVRIPVLSMGVSQASQSLCPKSSIDFSKKKLKELVQMGNSCIRIEDIPRLEEVGHATNRKEPFQPWGSYFLSVAAEARGELPRARWMVELALKKNPAYGILNFQKGRLLWIDNQYTEALQEIKKAIQMDPGLIEGHLFLGQVYFRDQEFELASEYFYSVLKARASDMIALLGLAESRMNRSDFRGAMEVINRGISYHPDVIEFQLRRAQIYETGLNDKVNALNAYIQLKRKLAKTPSKVITLIEVENKIQQIENSKRQPAVSSLQSPQSKEVNP